MDPSAVGPLQPILDIGTRALDASFESFVAKHCAIIRVDDVQPRARALGHLRSIHADQVRQGFRPALERTVGPGDHMTKLRNTLSMAQSLFTLLQ